MDGTKFLERRAVIGDRGYQVLTTCGVLNMLVCALMEQEALYMAPSTGCKMHPLSAPSRYLRRSGNSLPSKNLNLGDNQAKALDKVA